MSKNGGFLITRDADVLAKGQTTEAFNVQQQVHSARRRGEQDLEHAAVNIKTEYRKRLADSSDLLARLEHQLGQVNTELRLCEAGRADAVRLLAEFQRPLALTLQWQEARAQRPVTPGQDGVERALSQARHDLKQQLAQAASELVALDTATKELAANKSRLEVEIRDKSSAITLDKACLIESFRLPTNSGSRGEVIPPTTTEQPAVPPSTSLTPGGGAASTARSPRPPGYQRVTMQTHALHTENEYRNTTLVSVSKANAAVEAAGRARKKLASTVIDLTQSGKLKKSAVVADALSTRIKESTAQCTALKYNAKMLSGELQALQKQQTALAATVAKIEAQLKETQRRLDLRLVRPIAESSSTGVEETLELESVKLKSVLTNLSQQSAELEARRVRLVHLLDKVHKEEAYRLSGLAIDKQCQAMTLPTLPEIPERFKSMSSPRQPSQR